MFYDCYETCLLCRHSWLGTAAARIACTAVSELVNHLVGILLKRNDRLFPGSKSFIWDTILAPVRCKGRGKWNNVIVIPAWLDASL